MKQERLDEIRTACDRAIESMVNGTYDHKHDFPGWRIHVAPAAPAPRPRPARAPPRGAAPPGKSGRRVAARARPPLSATIRYWGRWACGRSRCQPRDVRGLTRSARQYQKTCLRIEAGHGATIFDRQRPAMAQVPHVTLHSVRSSLGGGTPKGTNGDLSEGQG